MLKQKKQSTSCQLLVFKKPAFLRGVNLSKVTARVSEYIRTKGINLSKIARDTGIPYTALYNSLMHDGRKRDLRDEEFLKVCGFFRY